MAATNSLTEILQDFKSATNLALSALPASDALLPPADGISLLDAKNELFLSYLQALALRNLTVIRSLKDGKSLQETEELNNTITKKLVEQRVYLEKGVRPLEQKIQFQIDRVLNIANEDERTVERKAKQALKVGHREHQDNESGNSSDEEDEDEDNASDDVDETLYRPNPSAILASTNDSSLPSGRSTQQFKEGVYRPPRISATSMPTTETRERKERRPGRSATVDEYISTELSQAPLSQPSIGSTITAGGRKTKDARQLAKEQERRDYEETNLVRLPPESRKERAKRQRRDRGGAFGGEEWRELGNSVDRIGDLTKRKNKGGALEKSRKRRATEDGPRGDGVGDAFEARKRRVMKKMKR